jgi:hypothetical protein
VRVRCLALIAVGRALIAVTLAGRVLLAEIPVVTAERVLMAVILIVEGDVFIREIVELMIEDRGHNILSASDVGEALSLLRSPQHIDALFTDMRVLYTTENSIVDKMTDLCVEGARFLQKPYTQHQQQNSVEEVLAA